MYILGGYLRQILLFLKICHVCFKHEDFHLSTRPTIDHVLRLFSPSSFASKRANIMSQDLSFFVILHAGTGENKNKH